MSRYTYFAITSHAQADMSEVVVVDNMAALAEWARKKLVEAAQPTSPMATIRHKGCVRLDLVGIAYKDQPTVVRLSVELWRIPLTGSLAWAEAKRERGHHILVTLNQ
jgi:hypothetical protein